MILTYRDDGEGQHSKRGYVPRLRARYWGKPLYLFSIFIALSTISIRFDALLARSPHQGVSITFSLWSAQPKDNRSFSRNGQGSFAGVFSF